MGKDSVNIVLLASVLLAFTCPIPGIISLCYSIDALCKYKKNDLTFGISLKRACKWLKITLIFGLCVWLLLLVFFNFLYLWKGVDG